MGPTSCDLATIDGITRKGSTEHEMLDNIGLGTWSWRRLQRLKFGLH